MWKFLLTFVLAMPAVAQIDRAQFMNLLEENKDQALIAMVREQCVGFRFDEAAAARLAEKPAVLVAVLNCLYDRAPVAASAAAAPDASGGEAAPAASTPPRQAYASLTSEQIYARKTAELLNSLTVAARMDDPYQRVKTLAETRTFFVNMLSSRDYRLTPEAYRASPDGGAPLPDWAASLMVEAETAKREGFPRLSFDADRRVELAATPVERGLSFFVGLYMVRELPERGEPYELEDQFLYTHEAFPLTYDAATREFHLAEMPTKIRQSRVQYADFLNDREPLTLFPGHWVFRASVYNKAGRIRADDYHGFTVAPGKTYRLRLFWEEKRPGVKNVGFELVEQ